MGSLAQPVLDQFEEIRIVETDKIFEGFQKQGTIPLSENHYDYVLKEGLDKAGMILLADSTSCEVEGVKHISKPFYGVQFHPERITVKDESHPEGHKIIKNFFRHTVKR